MEQNNENEQAVQPEEHYEPRPAWQLWGARIGLVVFLLLVILQILSIARGGL
ncbi:MAG: hypothetical protein Q4F17_00295 [Eubacteriales bacterium]|nr:hypothetical protein [Eubacteriales bacterium]